jgi:hypothetical protein
MPKYGYWPPLPTTDHQWCKRHAPCLCKSRFAGEIETISWAEDTGGIDKYEKKNAYNINKPTRQCD